MFCSSLVDVLDSIPGDGTHVKLNRGFKYAHITGKVATHAYLEMEASPIYLAVIIISQPGGGNFGHYLELVTGS